MGQKKGGEGDGKCHRERLFVFRIRSLYQKLCYLWKEFGHPFFNQTAKHMESSFLLVLFVFVALLGHACAEWTLEELWKSCTLEFSVKNRSVIPLCVGKYEEVISVGDSHTCALTSEGAYECIGSDSYGQANKKEPKYPKNFANGVKYVQVSAGSSHTCALTSEGVYECIGYDYNGRANNLSLIHI